MSFLPRKHLRSRQKHCLTLHVLILAFLQWLLSEFEFLLGDGMPWILQQLHKLGIAASVGVVSTMTTIAQCCQDRLLRIWHKQHSRARNINVIPAMYCDVATMKQDLSDIKEDLSGIQQDPH